MQIGRNLGAVLFAGGLALQASDAPAQSTASPTPVVVAVGRGELEATPDRAVVLLAIRATGKTAAEAAKAGAARGQQVLDALRAKLGAGDRAETASNRVEPVTVYDAGKPPRITGYAAEHRIRAFTGKTNEVGALLDAVTAAADLSVESVQFELADPSVAQAQALRLAAKDARVRATAIAEGLGLAIGPVRSARELGGPGPVPMGDMRMKTMRAEASAETQVLAPQLEVTTEVEVSFDLATGPRS